jgi:hypothetical protein
MSNSPFCFCTQNQAQFQRQSDCKLRCNVRSGIPGTTLRPTPNRRCPCLSQSDLHFSLYLFYSSWMQLRKKRVNSRLCDCAEEKPMEGAGSLRFSYSGESISVLNGLWVILRGINRGGRRNWTQFARRSERTALYRRKRGFRPGIGWV